MPSRSRAYAVLEGILPSSLDSGRELDLRVGRADPLITRPARTGPASTGPLAAHPVHRDPTLAWRPNRGAPVPTSAGEVIEHRRVASFPSPQPRRSDHGRSAGAGARAKDGEEVGCTSRPSRRLRAARARLGRMKVGEDLLELFDPSDRRTASRPNRRPCAAAIRPHCAWSPRGPVCDTRLVPDEPRLHGEEDSGGGRHAAGEVIRRRQHRAG